MQRLVRDLNRVYRAEPALWEVDAEPDGFTWLEPNDADANVLAFLRHSGDGHRVVACACNFSPVPREGYRLGLPRSGRLARDRSTPTPRSTAAPAWATWAPSTAEDVPWHGQPASAAVTIPPLGVVWLVPA